ncbi:GGDEF domain-containing protein, partial [Pseudomonas sp. SIMBA_068]|uniref:GGDEF domain-containing protein n=1 Tax=Pseudomonas sp. SIMBA_068 TaxID=3085808 RepID=UPI00397DDF2E
TLCLIDIKPRDLDDEDRALLRDLARMAEQELAAVQIASMDELTLLSNRRGFEALARHALGVCKRLEKPATLLFFDLNDFKQINDT